MAFIPALPSLPAHTAGRARLMASPPRLGIVASPNRRRATPAAAPAMTLAAVGRPPAAASPSDPTPPTASAATATPAPARAMDVAEVVAPITSFDEYMEMLQASSGGVAVLKFYAPWCRSCRAIAPKVARLAHEFPEIRFYEIDYEANKELCWRLGVKNLPTFHFYSGAAGRVEDFNAGPARAHVIREKVVEYALGKCTLPTPAAVGSEDAADRPAVGASVPAAEPASSVGGASGWGSSQ
ncbi:hypothetical protein BU14_0353s0004 [Porphyra umbilicalis]|uniref:Thioredoxin domain-containing protein n=1 Tax=Porphyra umbilicalis TaxID=2786 RepID=A0A1X6NXU9_PORUM|nr:hypothetical protein BU14_0353s0004 [Porphyra umbilicalis]|eukprot:OSX73360.1 hypothetical protein BU14_0353s0004 [Porphyra umbilicalis]